ncbi:M48 family metallopeptidase [Deinococcus planocerae]|uniref:M48 family metallopeptidase n=1 Tax=Deinococcus planocerae TaxID=1737569 RepID=UPI001FE65166|nr:YgjP-like metallopeptidase domain-containing protein [Deinococcus planocerae]
MPSGGVEGGVPEALLEFVRGFIVFNAGVKKAARYQQYFAVKEAVRVTRGELLVTVRTPDRTARVLNAWLRGRARAVLGERLTRCLEQAAPFGIRHDGSFQLRTMWTRWGSCTRAGRLTFNPLLIQAPGDCIDYVLLHELCHTAEFGHSSAYYALLGRMLPDWKSRRSRLNRLVELAG